MPIAPSKLLKITAVPIFSPAIYAQELSPESLGLLIPLIPYIRHFHAKFYEMTEDMVEYQIPYETSIPILLNGGIDASLVSEYEGQRFIQDASEPVACEQIRRQHLMLRKLLGEV